MGGVGPSFGGRIKQPASTGGYNDTVDRRSGAPADSEKRWPLVNAKKLKGGLVILHGLAYSIHTSLFCFLTCTALHYDVRSYRCNLIATDFVLRSEPHSTATVPRHSPDLLYHVRICQHAHRRPSSTTLYTLHAAPQSSTQMRRARGWLFELDAATW